MIQETIGDITFCEKEVAMPTDIWTSTKLDYLDESSLGNQPRTIAVEFGGDGDRRISVRRCSHDESSQREGTGYQDNIDDLAQMLRTSI